jgi:Domain of unknown function (DUF4411)
LYLFDASVLITAHNTYYPVDDIPEYWEWISHQGTIGNIKIPIEILEEVLAGSKKDDLLVAWMSDNKEILRLHEDVDAALVNTIVTQGYAADLTDDEIIKIGRDPFLIAYGLVNPTERCVVTAEPAAPSKQRANRRIPDVCSQFRVPCQNPFTVYKSLGFKTSWKR